MDLLQEEEGDELLEVAAIGEAVPAVKVVSLQHPRRVQQALHYRLHLGFHLYASPVYPPPRMLHHPGDRCHRLLPGGAVLPHVALHSARHILLALPLLRAIDTFICDSCIQNVISRIFCCLGSERDWNVHYISVLPFFELFSINKNKNDGLYISISMHD